MRDKVISHLGWTSIVFLSAFIIYGISLMEKMAKQAINEGKTKNKIILERMNEFH